MLVGAGKGTRLYMVYVNYEHNSDKIFPVEVTRGEGYASSLSFSSQRLQIIDRVEVRLLP